jgi:uncharacterized protein (UPF0147 family)
VVEGHSGWKDRTIYREGKEMSQLISTERFVRNAAAKLVPIIAEKIEEAGGPLAVRTDDAVSVAHEFASDAVVPLERLVYPTRQDGELWDDEMVLLGREIAQAALAGLKALGYDFGQ